MSFFFGRSPTFCGFAFGFLVFVWFVVFAPWFPFAVWLVPFRFPSLLWLDE